MRKYLKNIEDIEALRNTDTVIYNARCDLNYLRFINGILCQFSKTGKLLRYNIGINVCGEDYIEVEDEPSEDYIGKLGWFYDYDEDEKDLDFLKDLSDAPYPYKSFRMNYYEHFRPLTPEEVEKYTGYKVVKEK